MDALLRLAPADDWAMPRMFMGAALWPARASRGLSQLRRKASHSSCRGGEVVSRTPTPWNTGGVFEPDSAFPHMCIWGPTPPGYASGDQVAQIVGVEDAAHIVKCVNAHDELVAALRSATQMHAMPTDYGTTYRDQIGAMKKARDLLRKLDAQ